MYCTMGIGVPAEVFGPPSALATVYTNNSVGATDIATGSARERERRVNSDRTQGAPTSKNSEGDVREHLQVHLRGSADIENAQ